MSAAKKVMDVVSPSDALPTVQIETRKRVVIDDVQDKNLLDTTPQASYNTAAENRTDVEPDDVQDPTSELPPHTTHEPADREVTIEPVQNLDAAAMLQPDLDSAVQDNDDTTPSETETDDDTSVSNETVASEAVESPNDPVIDVQQSDDQTAGALEKADDSTADDETLATQPQAVSDATPALGQTLTSQLQATMDHPQAFDTTEYFVPIGQTKHRHKLIVESLIFGAVLAVAVVVAIVVVFS